MFNINEFYFVKLFVDNKTTLLSFSEMKLYLIEGKLLFQK